MLLEDLACPQTADMRRTPSPVSIRGFCVAEHGLPRVSQVAFSPSSD